MLLQLKSYEWQCYRILCEQLPSQDTPHRIFARTQPSQLVRRFYDAVYKTQHHTCVKAEHQMRGEYYNLLRVGLPFRRARCNPGGLVVGVPA